MKRRHLVVLGLAAATPFARARTAPVTIGVLPGPHAEILAQVQAVAAGRGLVLQTVERESGRQINADVLAGRLDVACFQDGVAFAGEPSRRRDALVELARTVTLPVAIYSRRVAAVRQLPRGASIAIPRERAAAARALVLLHNHGLIELRHDSGLAATPRDVTGNRYALRLVPTDTARLAAALHGMDAAVIDRDTAGAAGLQPGRDSIGLEDGRSPWSDVMAIRAADRDAPWAAELLAAYRSEPVKRFLLERFQDSVRRPW